jgi:hypothetical protein
MADLIEKIQAKGAGLQAKAVEIVKKYSTVLWRSVLDKVSAGTSSDTLSRRTGSLARSIQNFIPEISEGTVTGGVIVSEKYAIAHFGPRGSEYPIVAKKQFLTIPTDFVKTAAGVAKGQMEGGPPWTFLGMPTFISKGVIFGKLEGGLQSSEGVRQRRAAGEKMSKDQIIPLFILKSSVMIPRRIDMQQDVLDPIRPQFVADCQTMVSDK